MSHFPCSLIRIFRLKRAAAAGWVRLGNMDNNSATTVTNWKFVINLNPVRHRHRRHRARAETSFSWRGAPATTPRWDLVCCLLLRPNSNRNFYNDSTPLSYTHTFAVIQQNSIFRLRRFAFASTVVVVDLLYPVSSSSSGSRLAIWVDYIWPSSSSSLLCAVWPTSIERSNIFMHNNIPARVRRTAHKV